MAIEGDRRGDKAMAAAKGPVHALRGTGEAEKLLKNAKTELWNEYEEIGNYVAIEELAKAVGDKETEKLARDHRKQEERMAAFLTKLLPQLTKAVVTEEIPAAERRKPHEPPPHELARQARSTSRAKSTTSRAKSSSTRAKPARLARQVVGAPHDEPEPHAHRSQVVLTWLRRSAAQQQPGDDPAEGVPDDRRDAPVDGLLGLVGIEVDEAVEGAGEEVRRVAHELHDVVGPVRPEQYQHDPEQRGSRPPRWRRGSRSARSTLSPPPPLW